MANTLGLQMASDPDNYSWNHKGKQIEFKQLLEQFREVLGDEEILELGPKLLKLAIYWPVASFPCLPRHILKVFYLFC